MANGKIIEPMATDNSSTLTAMFTEEIGSTIRLTVKAPILMSMARSTKAHGKMIYSMDTVKRHGLMEVSTRASTSLAKSTVEEGTAGPMEANTMASGSRTRLKA